MYRHTNTGKRHLLVSSCTQNKEYCTLRMYIIAVGYDLETVTRERDELLLKQKRTYGHVSRSRRVKPVLVRNTTVRDESPPGAHTKLLS